MAEYISTACRLKFHERCNDRACMCDYCHEADELHEGPDVPAVPPISETGREFACVDPAELERLRARDEEIDAVVQAWRELRGVQDAIRTGRGLQLGQALDRLTTAHGRVLLFRALDGEKD